MPPGTSSPVRGSSATWPEQYTTPACTIAWLYGPIAFGASGVETGRRSCMALAAAGESGAIGTRANAEYGAQEIVRRARRAVARGRARDRHRRRGVRRDGQARAARVRQRD